MHLRLRRFSVDAEVGSVPPRERAAIRPPSLAVEFDRYGLLGKVPPLSIVMLEFSALQVAVTPFCEPMLLV